MIIYIVNHDIHGIDRKKKPLHARTQAPPPPHTTIPFCSNFRL